MCALSTAQRPLVNSHNLSLTNTPNENSPLISALSSHCRRWLKLNFYWSPGRDIIVAIFPRCKLKPSWAGEAAIGKAEKCILLGQNKPIKIILKHRDL
jgi:hypothetical protein